MQPALGNRAVARLLATRTGHGCAAPRTIQRAGPCKDVAAPHRLLLRGAVHPAVREAQRKLNLVDFQETEAGRPGLTDAPLVEDCVFGEKTFNAVVSFQTLAFPGQPAEHDGKIGDRTWAALDQRAATSPPAAPAPAPVTGPQLRATMADLFRISALSTAITKLTALQGMSPLGMEFAAPAEVATIKSWLNVLPSDPAFFPTVVTAKALMASNRQISADLRVPPQSDAVCGTSSDFGRSFVGQPEKGVYLCQNWVTATDECQKVVVIHEFFHLVGLTDVDTNLKFPARTTAQALNDAAYMAGLTQELATGREPTCDDS